MNHYSFLAFFASCLIALTVGHAQAEEVSELTAGRYVCATVTTGSLLDAMEVTIAREGEHMTANIQSGEGAFTGKQIGNHLYLVRQDISDLGLEIVQVIGTVRLDGSVSGIATRTLDGNVTERGAFTLRRLSQ